MGVCRDVFEFDFTSIDLLVDEMIMDRDMLRAAVEYGVFREGNGRLIVNEKECFLELGEL